MLPVQRNGSGKGVGMSKPHPEVTRYLKKIGKAGGKKRAENLTAEERSEASRLAASAPRKPDAKRCPCGKNTLKRAKVRNFECCKKAGNVEAIS